MIKKLIVLGTLLSAMIASTAWADKPCKPIAEACKKAGYYQGGAKEHKGLFQDCVKPITDGKTIANVTVDPATVAACKVMVQQKEQEQANKN